MNITKVPKSKLPDLPKRSSYDGVYALIEDTLHNGGIRVDLEPGDNSASFRVAMYAWATRRGYTISVRQAEDSPSSYIIRRLS